MKPILQHLVEMTGHRDHLRLEVSVLSTLQKLSGIKEVRALELFTDNGQRLVDASRGIVASFVQCLRIIQIQSLFYKVEHIPASLTFFPPLL